MLELSTAQDDADFHDVYRFWYDVYVIEMGRHRDDANTSHQDRTLHDPLAMAGSLCVARRDGEVVGTVLTTPVDHPATEKYRTLYGLDHLDPTDQWASGITTKFMVRADQRRTRLPLRLAFAACDWSLRVGMKHSYIDCNDHLLHLFSRLGFEAHLPVLYHKDYGQVNSLHLNFTDEAHLRNVGSPFLPVLQRFLREQGVVAPARPQPQPGKARAYHPPFDASRQTNFLNTATN